MSTLADGETAAPAPPAPGGLAFEVRIAPGGAEAVAGKDAVLDDFLTSFLAVLDKSLFGRRAG